MNRPNGRPTKPLQLMKPRQYRSFRLLLPILTACLLILTNCGGGGDGGGGHAPSISNLQYSPNSTYANGCGGNITVTGTFDVVDIGGDLKEAYLTTYDANGGITNDLTLPINNASGMTMGTLYGEVTFDTSISGDYTFRVSVSDFQGNLSNILTGPFGILPLPPPPTPTVYSPGYSISNITTGLCASIGIDISPTGDIYIADNSGKIFKVDINTNNVEIYASNNLSYCHDVTFDELGNLYVAAGSGNPRTIYKVLADGNYQAITTGSYTVGLKYFDGSLYLGNSGDGTITKVTSGVSSTLLSGYGGPDGPFGLTFDNSANLYFVQHGTGQIWKSTPDGLTVTALTTLSPLGPSFVAVDEIGSVFVSEPSTASIWKISNGTRTLFASGFSGGASPPYIGPHGLSFDDFGNLYVADAGNLWKISPP